MSIIDEIIARRTEEIKGGRDTGNFIPPQKREVPLSDFGADPFIIAEVKKKSPSKGVFLSDFNHIEIASSYLDKGIRNISVITEKNYFAGSLSYLYEIKKLYPDAAVLRKDFLVCENDIEVSYNSGADALLLIASALDRDLLEKMYRMTLDKGMKALVEIHDTADLEKVRSFKPSLIGINSRDLKDFSLDMISPLLLKEEIDWECSVVYESGIRCRSDALYALSSGFSGILTGESVIKNRNLASVYKEAFFSYKEKRKDPDSYFWKKLYSRRSGGNVPLLKICGICSREDCIAAAEAGADIIGMVFAPSVREADIMLPVELSDIDVLKVAVLVNPDPDLMSRIKKYIEDGYIDAVQLSGDENPDFCSELDIPFYKTLRFRNPEDCSNAEKYHSVRILTDRFVKGSYGGSGKGVPDNVLEAVSRNSSGRLWLAGGISLSNVSYIIEKYSPELIDASSSLESEHGKKDHEKMKLFIRKVKKY